MRDWLRLDEQVEDDDVEHYGILRKSGRYPWGSAGNEVSRSRDFLSYRDELLRKGLTPAEIAAGLSTDEHPFNTTMLREATTIARNTAKAADIIQAERLKDKGYKTTKIAEIMGRNESSIRALLKPGEQEKLQVLHRIVDFLRDQVERLGAIDIGRGNEHHASINVARNKLDTAISILRDEGYAFQKVQVPQATGLGKTTVKVLAKPEFDGKEGYRALKNDPSLIKTIDGWTEDGGESFVRIKPPLPLNPNRVAIRYKEDGGDKADGVILVREGIPDLSLGKSRYAQVRIQVGKGHYMKGMAMYSDDIPDGVDVVFNSPKSRTDIPDKLDAFKPLKLDKETGEVDKVNPFGSIVRQLGEKDNTGDIKKVTSVMNLVNEQGDWNEWQDSLSTQMLSKQRSTLAKKQLDLAYDRRRESLEEIKALSNPAVRKMLLEKFADEADSAAVEMKAHPLPGQSNHVILPISDMKPTEIYAPNFSQGDRVVLIRHPHGGKFEIPELVVNNNQKTAKRLLGQAIDAVGINHEVAEKLSGADFDGDTVLVIPNNRGEISTKSALQDLKGFNAKETYRKYDGMRTIDGGVWNEAKGEVVYGPKGPSSHMQKQMGDISNLITDMTIRGASDSELARAVRHSMVVIDAQKHVLNYKQSAIDNGIRALQEKYQKPYTEKGNAAASTLISRAKGRKDVPDRPYRGKVDPVTGRKIYGDAKTWVDSNGELHTRTKKSQALRETDDAHTLSSGTKIESVYADHSNRLKSLANEARKEWYHTPSMEKDSSAAKVYKDQVDSLGAKLKEAISNAPKERAAQIMVDTAMKARLASNPHMDDAEKKKTQALLIQEMRLRLGAKKTPIYIEDAEWQAIQAGAVSHSMATEIFKNADLKRVRELATPRARTVMTSVKQQSARNLLALGRTQAEVAQILGVSLSTLKSFLEEG